MEVLVTGGTGDIGGTVVAELRKEHQVSILDRRPSSRHPDLAMLQVDLEDSASTKSVVKGFDAIVHLAAIPDPFSDPDDAVFRINLMATFNLMEAVRINGIPRIVYGCSESASGFGIHNAVLRPISIPIDENHPCWPHESYSLSKYFGEVICEQYARAYGVQAISLRYTWVWGGERNRDEWVNIIRRGSAGGEKDWLGAWIGVDDVAQGVRLACAYQFMDSTFPFQSFFLSARDNFTEMGTLELVRRNWPDETPPVTKPEIYEANPKASVFDISKARELLGYEPSVTVENLAKSLGIPRDRRLKS